MDKPINANQEPNNSAEVGTQQDERHSRRQFLHFFGRSAAALALGGMAFGETGCKKSENQPIVRTTQTLSRRPPQLPFQPITPQTNDRLVLAGGLTSQIVASWGDVINTKGDTFGYNNDFTAYLPIQGSQEGLLWVNHESPHSLFVGKQAPGETRTKEQVLREQYAVGGSLVRVKRNAKGKWSLVTSDPRNRRFHARTAIPLQAPRPIAGSQQAKGTLANCCGGTTPWGHILTCEENTDEFYGDIKYNNGKRTIDTSESYHGWQTFFPEPPEHYGWVVEINPQTGSAHKRTALGRFAHEGATVTQAKDGRCVVYMGDDSTDQCIYKFIASKPNTLEEGELFVADVSKGLWRSLSIKKQPILQTHFRDQTDVLIRTREAAKLVGGTPMARPEGIQVDPQTKAIYICLTNHKGKENLFGSIFKIEEANGDHLSMHFSSSTFLAGGPQTGFACPDNLAFDPSGNLWMTNDISTSQIGKGPYQPFGHNALHCIPLRGKWAGKVLRVASAPTNAELTGMSFTPDGQTLFLSVQHPGSRSKSMTELTSHWPNGGTAIPKPSVVAISGPALQAIQQS